MENLRQQAAFAVFRWLETREFPQKLLPQGQGRAFVQELVYTVIRRKRALDMVLGRFVKRMPEGELRALLYIGAAQIIYMTEVQEYAAVHETVEAVKHSSCSRLAGLVNGVLRNLIRNRKTVMETIKKSPVEVRESFPTVMVNRWRQRFSEDEVEKLCQHYNQPAVTYLARKDGTYTALERGMRVDMVPGFEEGEFIVQDPATRLSVELLDVHEGESVLDACAAPGGKSVQIAWRGAKLTACEVNLHRRERLVENLQRTRLSESVEVVDNLSKLEGRQFSKILVDAPCSNTGVLMRRPDARWNWSEQGLNQLVKLQAEILDKTAALVAPGGRLVYSTCSIEPEENDLQVAAFLERHPEFTLLARSEELPFNVDHDGAFAASLQKQGN